MRKPLLSASACLLSLLLLLAGCQAPQSSAPPAEADEASPTETLETAPGLDPDVAGFEHSLFGDSMETVMQQEGAVGWQLVKVVSSFAGLGANAYFQFDEDGNLSVGFYRLNPSHTQDEFAVYRKAVDYLTELYGAPSSAQYYTAAGPEAPLSSLEEVEEAGGQACTFWTPGVDKKDSAVYATLDLGGEVLVVFLNTVRTADGEATPAETETVPAVTMPEETGEADPEVTLEIAPGLDPDVAGFEHSLFGDSMETVMQQEGTVGWQLVKVVSSFAGLGANAYFQFDEDGNLSVGFYRLNPSHTQDGFAVYRKAVDYLTELYGAPSSSQYYTAAGTEERLSSLEEVEEVGGQAWTFWPSGGQVKKGTSIYASLDLGGETLVVFLNTVRTADGE